MPTIGRVGRFAQRYSPDDKAKLYALAIDGGQGVAAAVRQLDGQGIAFNVASARSLVRDERRRRELSGEGSVSVTGQARLLLAVVKVEIARMAVAARSTRPKPLDTAQARELARTLKELAPLVPDEPDPSPRERAQADARATQTPEQSSEVRRLLDAAAAADGNGSPAQPGA